MKKLFLLISLVFIVIIDTSAKPKALPDTLFVPKVEKNGVRVDPIYAPHYILRYPDKFVIGKEKWKIQYYYRDIDKGEAFALKHNGKVLRACLIPMKKSIVLDEPLMPVGFPSLQKFYGPVIYNAVFTMDGTDYYIILPQKKTYFDMNSFNKEK